MEFRGHGGATQFLYTAIRWLAVDGAALRLDLVVAASGRTLRFLADDLCRTAANAPLINAVGKSTIDTPLSYLVGAEIVRRDQPDCYRAFA